MNSSNKFYDECISIFENSRYRFIVVCDNYVSRLGSTLENLDSHTVCIEGELEKNNQPFKVGPHKKIQRVIASSYKTFKLLLYQKKYLSKLMKLKGEDYVSVLCFASNRNPLDIQSGNVREQIKEWLKDFRGSESPQFVRSITRGGILCLVDVAQTEWSMSDLKKLSKESIFILNDKILAARVFHHMIVRPWSIFSALVSLPGVMIKHNINRKTHISSLATYFVFRLFRRAFEIEFSKIKKIEVVLITNNSILAESLRFFMLSNTAVNTLCEVSHGINNSDVDSYIENICDAENKYFERSRHVFIEQIPDLPKFGKKMSKQEGDGKYAINVYINRYLSNYSFDKLAFRKKMFNIMDDLGLDGGNADKLIVSFIGYVDQDEDLTNKHSFLIECELMVQILNTAKSLGKDISLVYSALPAVNYKKLCAHPFFTDNNVILYQSTLSMYFIADLSTGLISSSAFEASYFGSSVLMPMTKTDKIYPQDFLSLFYFPATDKRKELLIAMNQWMMSRDPLSKLEKQDEICKRIDRYGSWG